jgi:hypothetical protein
LDGWVDVVCMPMFSFNSACGAGVGLIHVQASVMMPECRELFIMPALLIN